MASSPSWGSAVRRDHNSMSAGNLFSSPLSLAEAFSPENDLHRQRRGWDLYVGF